MRNPQQTAATAEPLLSVADLQIAKLNVRGKLRLARLGKLPGARKVAGRWMLPLSAWQAYLAGTTPAVSSAAADLARAGFVLR